MPLSVLFWVVYVVAIFFGAWLGYGQPGWPRSFGGHIVLWLLVGILGWRVFGSVVK